MFIISLTYHAPSISIEKHIEGHIAFLDKYYQKQKFICSGRKKPRTGGVILAYNCTIDEINEILKEDPFYINKIATYEIIEFTPTKYDKHFEWYSRI
ncbi:YciI family protein [Elizabethkingia anophelis]|uniref:YciI family protein n=1 Tax=Elizabethkingia anophelis TaxID=1117645 RepID=UPI0020B1CFB3|nr:YciI family protein [Elizabethkingia anophelis]MCT4306150.1 GTP cyclohydrolase [Elizabethkingia anophelis]MDV3831809.1 GTP cyclohydrolase [Elizabethkingia anophelis]UTF95117.1 GTP cyclohydrolase [Elizabethkingia anophelis]